MADDGKSSVLETFVSSPSKKGLETDLELRSVLRSFSDYYGWALAESTEELGTLNPTPKQRLAIQKVKTVPAYKAFLIANGQNPRAGLIDMVILVSLTRTIVDQDAVDVFGEEAGNTLTAIHQRLEKRIWTITAKYTMENQRAELARLVARWRENNPDDDETFDVWVNLNAVSGVSAGARAKGGSMFGLSDATRAVDEARILGNRALYMAERLPLLMTWQAELALSNLATTPELEGSVQNISQLPAALGEVSAAIEALPPLITAERKAVVNEVGALLKALEGQQTGVQSLLEETRNTLSEAAPLVSDVKASVEAGQQLVVDTTKTVALLTTGLEFANDLAARLEGLAGENGLDLESLDKTIGEFNRAVAGMNQTVQALERLILGEDADLFDRLFRVGASLILFFFLTALATAVAYRLILKRMIGV